MDSVPSPTAESAMIQDVLNEANGKPPRGQVTRPFHVLTIDVEDWPQSTLDHDLSISYRVVANTHTLLELLDEARTRATFFILGKVAETHPRLVREIAMQGHEVATHGYSHESVQGMTVARFRTELHRSVEILREQSGQPVLGHRAPDFSISGQFLHFLELLSEEGLVYDSSIFPIRHPRYGVPEAWRYPHSIRCASGRMLVEFPLATIQLAGMVLPAAGGGYFRLFPYWWTRMTLQALEQLGSPATCYVHPYEIDIYEMKEIPYRVPTLLRWSQEVNRRSVRPKLRRLLSEFSFVTMAEASEELKARRLAIGLDLSRRPAVYASSPEAVVAEGR
jgi:polysaccharide deacetylase family protein (PEP-CTERM system associated)